MRAFLLVSTIAAFAFSAPLVACSDDSTNIGSDTANLDTSGCGTTPFTRSSGAVEVTAYVPPWRSCWNLDQGSLTPGYVWFQENDDHPQKSNIGFYTALNGVGVFEKADHYACKAVPGGITMGPDTSGRSRTVYRCTAEKYLSFSKYPQIRDAGYEASGTRRPWQVEIAVGLDDEGHWDSHDGANYQFALQ